VISPRGKRETREGALEQRLALGFRNAMTFDLARLQSAIRLALPLALASRGADAALAHHRARLFLDGGVTTQPHCLHR